MGRKKKDMTDEERKELARQRSREWKRRNNRNESQSQRCVYCGKPAYSRQARYCAEHKRGRGVKQIDRFSPALQSFVKCRYFDRMESDFFTLLCGHYRLADYPIAIQTQVVHLIVLSVEIRRECARLKKDEERVSDVFSS